MMIKAILPFTIVGILCIQDTLCFPNEKDSHGLVKLSEDVFDHHDALVEGEQERAVLEKRESVPDNEYLENCGITHKLKDVQSIKFITPFFGQNGKIYPTNVKCSWNFIGDDDCDPEISCSTFDLASSDDCEDEYLGISDGAGGGEKLCGKKDFDKPIKASNGARDLFVKLETGGEDGKGKGVSCEARCSKDIKKARELSPEENPKKQEFQCVCGLRNQDDRIVGGQDVESINEFPWQVAIVFAGTRKPKCGASIINNRYVLSAAHCFVFDGTEPEDIEVLYHAKVLDATLLSGNRDVELGQRGSIRAPGYKLKKVTDKEEGTQRYKVAKIISHPLFTDKYDYDVSLVKLSKKIDLTDQDAPTPICLPEISESMETYVGKNTTVVGWGKAHQDAGSTTRMLQKLAIPVLKTEQCQKWMPYTLTKRMVCAGYEEGERDACQGDSGGPLIYQKPNKQWEQIGIVSWGEGCAKTKRPGLYSRVTELNQWIQYNAEGATWCRQSKSVED